ncbi:MAG: UDP-N-acetylglucosamine 2-epimerase (non-hydrolyzing) [Chlorobi bacterium]|nr:UDP-N-acetylglucosamine 2-epimerase (non-hydrolyzing) [Chlorobiota bacterium]
MNKLKIIVVIGTRPEAIKLAPVISLLKQQLHNVVVVSSSQHKELLLSVFSIFKIKPKYDLNVMLSSQSSHHIAGNVLIQLEEILKKEKPQLVIVQGDTTTACSGALAAFYSKIPVAHIESGLRTNDIYSPFPEEMNRRIISQIATLNFAPTKFNKNNLLKEGIPINKIFITGNTVLDSLKFISNHLSSKKNNYKLDIVNDKKIILITVHRNENFGIPMKNILNSINEIVNKYEDFKIIFPVHPNPKVKQAIKKYLKPYERIILKEPMNYIEFINLLSQSFLVMTDSGGIQEEAPAFGVPVIILRSSSERGELISSGGGLISGTQQEDITNLTSQLIENKVLYKKMTKKSFPFGKSGASVKIVKIIEKYLL